MVEKPNWVLGHDGRQGPKLLGPVATWPDWALGRGEVGGKAHSCWVLIPAA